MRNSSGDYFANQEKMEEMVRLKHQAALVTAQMAGVLPEFSAADLARVSDVLDLACGPGEWVMEVARLYPHVKAVGVDKSQRMIAWASAQAEAIQRGVSFEIMDITQPLAFPDEAFDLVNTRFIHSFMKREQWGAFLGECFRILRPGGILRMTEQESGFSNDLVYQNYIDLWGKAWIKSGHSFAHTRAYIGVTVVLKSLMRAAGFTDAQHRPISIDLSTGQPMHEELLGNLIEALELGASFLLRVGAASSQREINKLYEQMKTLKNKDGFCAYWLLQTVWSRKPVLLK
jgi:ubiquinone/menaquinone biosynthesis C-methylase UbiE